MAEKLGSFEEFLLRKEIDVIDGRILIKDAQKILLLQFEYDVLLAKEEGLPASLKDKADVIIKVSFQNMERAGQDPKKFNLTMPYSCKNHDDDDTWDADVVGTVLNIWNWALAESGKHPDEIKENIEISIQEFEEVNS